MAKAERDRFAKMAPKGFRIRMMEPGEAIALMDIRERAAFRLVETGVSTIVPQGESLDTFVRWLLAHEIFVATTKGGKPVGFAASRDLVDLYWLSGLYVPPEHGRNGVGRGLLSAVVKRAGWFFHRAIGLTTFRNVAFNAPFFERCGFVTVLRKDFPAILEDRFLAEMPDGAREEDRVAMVKWL